MFDDDARFMYCMSKYGQFLYLWTDRKPQVYKMFYICA